MSENSRLNPIGVTGELYIGGEGVSRGYINHPELTAEKFIKDPFSEQEGFRLYKTGDMARWLPDGNIIYVGRVDEQVKIRGYRIETGEIVSVLLRSGLVKEAAVLAWQSAEEKILVAYYTSDRQVGEKELNFVISEALPNYMVPACFLRLETMPLTHNGKLDRRALPDPEIMEGNEFEESSTDLEKKLAEIWADVLKLDKSRIGINQSFFELGGHSMKAILLVNKIFKELNVEVPLPEIFVANTIRKLSEYIENEKWAKGESQREIQAGNEIFI